MALTEDEIRQLKAQLSQQIQNLPEPQKSEAQHQIDEMSPEALELMLEQQKAQSQSPPPVYRMIVNKELDSVPVSENEEALAVLELRPIAKGHTIVIPKNAVKRKEDLSPGVIEFAKKIGEKIQKNLKPVKVDVKIEEKFGEVVLEAIPEYETPNDPRSERKEASKTDREEIARIINTEVIEKPKPEVIKAPEPVQEEKPIKLQRRIP